MRTYSLRRSPILANFHRIPNGLGAEEGRGRGQGGGWRVEERGVKGQVTVKQGE